jgi:hypothetical protein
MKIVRAKAEDAATLTAIALSSKRSWRYSERWLETWQESLTVRAEFIVAHETYTAVVAGRMVGFYALRSEGSLLAFGASPPLQPPTTTVTAQAPPPQQVEVAPVAPGPDYYWVPGYWYWGGPGWIWAGGRWTIRPWHGAIWVNGGWGRGRGGWHWRGGHWR